MIDLNYKKSLQKFGPIDLKMHELVPQDGVRLSLFPKECKYNAIWDYAVSPEGRHYFGLCAEHSYSAYAQFYEYKPDDGSFERCFKVEDSIVTYDRNIRASKIHTSICFMPDKRIIMTTHTTAAAPDHKYWLFMHYLNHPYEGYSGSNVLIYDPAAKKVEDCGIPVQRDTIYGACYDPSHNALYFCTYLRGRVYRLDLDNRNLTEYGQITGQGSFYMKMGKDGNIYFTTRNGCLLRIDTTTQKIEDVGFKFTPRSMMMPHAIDGPDGNLYMFAHNCPNLFVFNYNTKNVTGEYNAIPGEFKSANWNYAYGGGGFDEQGVLWYSVSMREGSDESIYSMRYLCRLDFNQKDPAPVNMGAMGTREHTVCSSCDAYVQNDAFFAVTSNHANDPPGIIKIDLEPVRRGYDKPRVLVNDPISYMGLIDGEKLYDGDLYADAEKYYENRREFADYNRFVAENRPSFWTPRCEISLLWMELGRGFSSVRKVEFNDDGDIVAVCGQPDNYTRVIIRSKKIISMESNYTYAESDRSVVAERFSHVKLPKQAGRNFLAVASAYCLLADNKFLVGTLDGMLAVVDGDKAFSLGSVSVGEPILSIASNKAGTTAYGVASDPHGFGMVFRFDMETGLTLYGYIMAHDFNKDSGYSYEPCTVAFAPDEKSIAIGARDNMGTVYRFFFEKGD